MSIQRLWGPGLGGPLVAPPGTLHVLGNNLGLTLGALGALPAGTLRIMAGPNPRPPAGPRAGPRSRTPAGAHLGELVGDLGEVGVPGRPLPEGHHHEVLKQLPLLPLEQLQLQRPVAGRPLQHRLDVDQALRVGWGWGARQAGRLARQAPRRPPAPTHGSSLGGAEGLSPVGRRPARSATGLGLLEPLGPEHGAPGNPRDAWGARPAAPAAPEDLKTHGPVILPIAAHGPGPSFRPPGLRTRREEGPPGGRQASQQREHRDLSKGPGVGRSQDLSGEVALLCGEEPVSSDFGTLLTTQKATCNLLIPSLTSRFITPPGTPRTQLSGSTAGKHGQGPDFSVGSGTGWRERVQGWAHDGGTPGSVGCAGTLEVQRQPREGGLGKGSRSGETGLTFEPVVRVALALAILIWNRKSRGAQAC